MNASKVVGAGVFVVVGALLFTVGLFMIGERRMLFEERFPLYAEFATLGQLEAGAIVRVAGMNAGEVTNIRVPSSPSGKFRVEMEVRKDLRQLIRTDSIATAQTEGLVGGIFLGIATGSETAPQVADGGTIQSREPFQVSDLLRQAGETVTMVNETVAALRGDIEGAAQNVALTAEDAQELLKDIRPDITAIAKNGSLASEELKTLLAGVNAGNGSIGKLLHDDTLYVRALQIADDAKVVMANMQEVSTEARRAIADFRSPDGPAQGVMGDMRSTLVQAREATADLADNLEAMKHNFLLRGFFNKRGYFDLDDISPAQYRAGVLEDGKRKAMRTWIGSAVLFEPGADGTVVLSAGGRAQLDSAMAAYLEHVPANPIVVEGYATPGTLGERFRLGRARAAVVRTYLMGRFDLKPQNTGYISLADSAKGSPDGDRWDGVSITLFLDREGLKFEAQKRVVAAALKDATDHRTGALP
jgi:phospholipid/cholesterol/gamma-HCH transport system substrate-binding protein